MVIFISLYIFWFIAILDLDYIINKNRVSTIKIIVLRVLMRIIFYSTWHFGKPIIVISEYRIFEL